MEKQNQKDVKVRYFYDDAFFEKDGMVIDKKCPKCKRPIFPETNFCNCGFFVKGLRNNVFWTGFFLTGFVILLGFLGVFVNLNTYKEKLVSELEIKKMDLTTVSPVNVQVLALIKDTKYDEYIQNVYVKHKEENKLVILIKPSLWSLLKNGEKVQIKNTVQNFWNEIYAKNNPDSNIRPVAVFANPD